MKSAHLTYIIIVNWNGWEDTIECLESIFRMEYTNFRVIVCDNASQNASLQNISAWAHGDLNKPIETPVPLRDLTFPPTKKPIKYIRLTQNQVETSGVSKRENAKLILIQNEENLGFAGGSNIGIRYALQQNNLQYIWLLNNDTIVKKDALVYMIQQMDTNPKAGLCGSTIHYYDNPDQIQSCGGGTYNKWFAQTNSIEMPVEKHSINATPKIDFEMDFILGVSMLIRKDVIINVGLLNEIFFLYFEELDIAIRLRGQFTLTYAPKSIIFHKEGKSIGSSSQPDKKARSKLSDYYGIRNRLLFTYIYFPNAVITVYVALLGASLNRVRRWQWDRARMILKIIIQSIWYSRKGVNNVIRKLSSLNP